MFQDRYQNTKTKNLPIYSDVNNLNYYFVTNIIKNLSVEILKSSIFETFLGKTEIAVIGGSHYLKINNKFTELLSCSNENVINPECKLQIGTNAFNYSYNAAKYKYNINIKSFEIQSYMHFLESVYKINNQDNDLTHDFNNENAITALNILKNQNSEFQLETFHTYPETNDIIYSKTTILNTNL